MENEHWFSRLLFVVLLVGMAYCFWRIGQATLSSGETVLLSILLTILSIIASVIASMHYSEVSLNRSLRTFAQKASEKVTNLSNELDRLSVYLQQELKNTSYDSTGEMLLSRNLRIESAIHSINTLKSINDGSLSDWRGVIGDEIDAKREEREERQEMLRELVERFESIVTAEDQSGKRDTIEIAPTEAPIVHQELDSIRKDLNLLAAQVSGVPLAQPAKVQRKQKLSKACPRCAKTIEYWQRQKIGGIKGLTCSKCGAALYSKENHGEFDLQLREPVNERITCPACLQEVAIQVDPVPGGNLDARCPSCDAALKLSRRTRGLRVRLVDSTLGYSGGSIDEILLERISQAMGAQPWPTGRGSQAARTLGVSKATLQLGINELINRGVYKVQREGKLYVLDQTANAPH